MRIHFGRWKYEISALVRRFREKRHHGSPVCLPNKLPGEVIRYGSRVDVKANAALEVLGDILVSETKCRILHCEVCLLDFKVSSQGAHRRIKGIFTRLGTCIKGLSSTVDEAEEATLFELCAC